MHPLSLHLLCVCVWVSLSLTFSMHSNNFTRNLQLYERNNNNNNIMWKRGKKLKPSSTHKLKTKVSKRQMQRWVEYSHTNESELLETAIYNCILTTAALLACCNANATNESDFLCVCVCVWKQQFRSNTPHNNHIAVYSEFQTQKWLVFSGSLSLSITLTRCPCDGNVNNVSNEWECILNIWSFVIQIF